MTRRATQRDLQRQANPPTIPLGALARHARKLQRIVDQLRRHRGGTVSLKKGTVSHQVPKTRDWKRRDAQIDVSDLDEILWLDPDERVCVAEPGVTFCDLVDAALPYGLVPAVVPELETITLGGAVSGCSLESGSFRVGGFHDTCSAYEVITAQGDILHCTPHNEHALVFQMMHGSFGTLGVLSLVTFRLIPAAPFVHLVHHTYSTLEAYQAAVMRQAQTQDADFMDGIIHRRDKYVLCLGRFVERAPYTNRYDWLKVYWESTGTRREDYLRTKDYFYRYDRGVTNVHPKSFLGRLVLGRFLSSTELLSLANRHPWILPKRPEVTVDLFIPFSRLPRFFEWYNRAIDFYPLWCVPYRRTRDYEWIADGYFDGLDDSLFIDLAIYGMRQPKGRNIYAEIEQELFDVQGVKTLISYNYYSESTFWRVFNKPNYDAVKRITDPNHLFSDLYHKTCRPERR